MSYYFDYAAATPISPTVLKAIEPYFNDSFYNPSAQYLAAKDIHAAIERARAEVAGILGAKPQEIIFTAGGTEANNIAINGVMRNYPDANCVVSAIEHEAVIAPAAQFNCKLLQVDQYGGVREDELRKLIDDNTVLVSIMYANNEIGTIQPLYRIKTILSEIRFERIKKGNSLPLYFHTDACQAPNYLQLRVNRLGVDMMTLNGSKIYGLKQSGMLYVNRDLTLTPLIYGGGQEKGMRSGTENVVGIIGFATALKETTALRDKEVVRLQDLQHKAWLYIAEHIPSAVVTGNAMPQLSNNLHVRFTDIDNERLMMELDEKGFQVAVGSACSASSDEPSHVLKAVGLTDKEAQSSIRITMGRQTTEVDLMALLHTIQQLVK